MTDIEQHLENLERLAGKKRGVSWEMAEEAYHIVGKRIPGATKQAALVCGITSPDAVEHWAKAWRLYRVFVRCLGDKITDVYREQFSVSHFYELWMLGHKHKIGVQELSYYLFGLLLYKNKGERWSVDVLKQEVAADYPDGKAVDWRWHWKRVTSDNLKALLSFDGELPLVVKAWARMGLGLKDKVK